jgi:hypothetical protein
VHSSPVARGGRKPSHRARIFNVALLTPVVTEAAGALPSLPRRACRKALQCAPRLIQDARRDVLLRLTVRALPRAYAVKMEDIEARSRLASVLDVCEHAMQALEALRDARLSGVLRRR